MLTYKESHILTILEKVNERWQGTRLSMLEPLQSLRTECSLRHAEAIGK